MKREYIPAAPEPASVAPSHDWWQSASTTHLRDAMARMTDEELHRLAAEIGGVIGLMQAQLEARTATDPAWARRARKAQAHACARNKIVRAELHIRGKQGEAGIKQARRESLRTLRERASNGEDLRDVVVALIDHLLGKAGG